MLHISRRTVVHAADIISTYISSYRLDEEGKGGERGEEVRENNNSRVNASLGPHTFA